jgi:hypothetical protein
MLLRLKGRIADEDALHQVVQKPEMLPIGASSVSIPGVGLIPQYAPTVVGNGVRFLPASDCDGYFTSSKFQAHNNCYNYAVDVATNTMAQPGRKHGMVNPGDIDAAAVVKGAEADGLKQVDATNIDDLRNQSYGLGAGHFVALLVTPAVASMKFKGDFHWVRCDDLGGSSWSQKDGPDQVTNFDFGGNPISDPYKANWTVNSGPFGTTTPGAPDFVVTYTFVTYMFVPRGAVDII